MSSTASAYTLQTETQETTTTIQTTDATSAVTTTVQTEPAISDAEPITTTESPAETTVISTTTPTKSVIETSATEPEIETEPMETIETGPEPELITYYFYDDWTWIGDSRTVGMAQCVGITYFAKSAMGLNWFLENYDTICSFRNQTIVINLGVNDLYNAYNYIDVFNNLPEEFTSSNCIYIMAVNPVDEAKEWNYGYSTSNASIENFNEILRCNLRSDFFFMDTYSYLWNDGFGTTDGLHYDAATYVKLYNYMISTITGA